MTTGSLVNGTVQGMANGLGGAGASGLDIGKITNIEGDPNGVLQYMMVGQIAYDGANAQAYQATTTGSTWVKLGSVA